MKASQRRQTILEILGQASQPVSASRLAEELQVSRQIIVGDVALLRANQQEIIATPKGYLLSQRLSSHQFTSKIVCCHGLEETEAELLLIIEKGGAVLDVEVEHPIYGMLTAALNIRKPDDVADFMTKINNSKASLLSTLTQGIHLHTISCPSREIFEEIKENLKQQGFLLGEE